MIGAHPPDLLRIRPLESRMLGNLHVRFGGGRMEKGVMTYLASRLPDRRALRCRRTDARKTAPRPSLMKLFKPPS